MGAWGTRLTDDDFAADIIGEYFERFDKGEEPKDIRITLEQSNEDAINDPDEGHIFWMALAKAQWDVGALDKDILEKVLKIVESDVDTKSWIERDGKKPEKRRQSITAFATQIQTARDKPRKRKKKILRSSPFETGDVVVFNTTDNNWGVVVVGEAEKLTEFGFTKIVALDLKLNKEPTLEQVVTSNVLMVNGSSHKGPEIHCCCYYAEYRKSTYEPFKVIGNLKVKKIKPPFDFYSAYGFWGNLVRSFEEGMERKSSKKYTLKKYLGYFPFQKIFIEKM